MIPCNRLRNSLRLSHSLASISSSERALDFGLAQSGNVLLSQVFPHVLDPPLAAHMGEPNQVHSLTSLKTTWEMDVTDA